jgi:hypothetical protein
MTIARKGDKRSMPTEPSGTRPAPVQAAGARIHMTPSGLAGWKLYEREIATYLRELPRLLQEGHTQRYVLIKGDEILGIWDLQGDAIEAGCVRFGLEPIFVKQIDPRDPHRFALLQAQLPNEENSTCPS